MLDLPVHLQRRPLPELRVVVMAARLILPPDADREEWLAERRKGVTASEIAALLGISPFESPFNLYWKKRGDIPEDYDDDRLSLGRHLEPWIAERFADAHPEFGMRAPAGLWASVERPWQLATPDGLLYDGQTYGLVERDGVFEIEHVAVWEGKTSATYEDWGEDGSDEIPAYIRAQALWQLDVMGVKIAHVSCLFLATQKIRTYVIEYDPVDVELMRKRACAFLDDVERGFPPPVDGHDATTTALKALYPELDEEETVTVPTDVAEGYRWARAQLAAAKAEAAEAENILRSHLEDAKYAVDCDGVKVASRSIYTVPEHVRRACVVDKLTPARKTKEPTS